MKPVKSEVTLRIVDQIRTMQAREYDLACGERRLTVHVEETEGPSPQWRVDATARARSGEVPRKATATAATRVDALRAVGAAWRDGAGEDLVLAFDWNVVEELLVGVRAL